MNLQTEILADAPAVYLPLSDITTSTGTATDASGNNRHGAVSNCTPSMNLTNRLRGIGFDGNTVKSRCEIAYTDSLNVFTVEIVIVPGLFDNSQVCGEIISHRQYYASGYDKFPFAINISPQRILSVALDKGNDYSADLILSIDDPLANNTITHIAVTRDSAGECRIYKNGELVKSGTLTGTLSTYSGAWMLGRASQEYDAGQNKSYYVGLMASFAMFPAALTPARIMAHASAALEITKWRIAGVARFADDAIASRVRISGAATGTPEADITPDPITGQFESTINTGNPVDITIVRDGYRPLTHGPITPQEEE